MVQTSKEHEMIPFWMNSQYIITRIIFLFEKIYLNKLWPKCKRKYVFGIANTNYTIYKYHDECNFFYNDKLDIQRKEIDTKHSLFTW